MRTVTSFTETQIGPREARLALSLAVAVAIAAAAWSVADHLTFGTNVFDSGIIDNALWRVTHGYDDVSSLNGRPLFADHPSGVLLALLPVYAVAPSWGLVVYLVARAISAGMLVWAAWLVTSHFGLDRVTRWVLIGATAVGPGMILVVTAEANTVGLAIGPLGLAIAVALRGGSRAWFAVLACFVAAARPEIALGVLMLGLVLRRRYPEYGRRALAIGAGFGVAGLVWLFAAGDAPGFSGHLGHLGDSFGDALAGAVRRPWDALAPLFDATPWASLVIWLGGFGLVAPMLSPRWLAAAAPLLAVPFLGTWDQADGHIWQYWHLLLPLGMVSAAATLGRGAFDRRRFHVTVVAMVPLMWLVAIPSTGQRLIPTLSEDGRAAAEIIDIIDALEIDSLSAPDPVVPHLTGRSDIHRFPVPFECGDLEVAGYRGPDLLPEAVMLHGEAFGGWRQRLAQAGYEIVAEEGIFTLWTIGDPAPAPALDCD